METVRIRDPGWKKSDPGSGINIPVPQHWFVFVLWLFDQCVFLIEGGDFFFSGARGIYIFSFIYFYVCIYQFASVPTGTVPIFMFVALCIQIMLILFFY
jgi:hypothetical protein